MSLRYSIKVKGTELLKANSVKLFLPNHQAIVDPLILMSQIYPNANVVPVVTSGYYDMPIVKSIFKSWGAIRVSDLQKGSKNINVLEDIITGVSQGFKNGKSVIIYPSGQIARQGYEKILNKKSAHLIVKDMSDEVSVIGVRISGLWGSMWSRAKTKKSPKFGLTMFKSLLYTLANFIFFMPRRKVSIEFFDLTMQCKEKAAIDKQEFNLFLEKFYNKRGEEKALFLKHFFYLSN